MTNNPVCAQSINRSDFISVHVSDGWQSGLREKTLSFSFIALCLTVFKLFADMHAHVEAIAHVLMCNVPQCVSLSLRVRSCDTHVYKCLSSCFFYLCDNTQYVYRGKNTFM